MSSAEKAWTPKVDDEVRLINGFFTNSQRNALWVVLAVSFSRALIARVDDLDSQLHIELKYLASANVLDVLANLK